MSKNTTNNKQEINNINNNIHDFKETVNRSLDETKNTINRSLDESKNQIPHYNNIVNKYHEQALQTVKEISDEYIESQKAIINSIQSAWKPYNESFVGFINQWNSPESFVKAYSKYVGNFADNAVSAVRLSNNIIFSNLDSWKSGLQQVRDNSRHIFNQNINTAKAFEHHIKESVKDSNANINASINA